MKKILLWTIFVIIAIHFLKDITQDILKISTPLDLLGDVQEDLSFFPAYIRSLFIGLGIGSFIAEAFLLLSIPLVVREKRSTLLEKAVWVILAALFVYFGVAILLDPRFRLNN